MATFTILPASTGIARITGISRDTHFLKMQYYALGTLASAVHDTSPFHQVREWIPSTSSWDHEKFTFTVALHIALALDYLHARGFAHRDVKPDNIVLDMIGSKTEMPWLAVKVCYILLR